MKFGLLRSKLKVALVFIWICFIGFIAKVYDGR
jgi:hypothetical protein